MALKGQSPQRYLQKVPRRRSYQDYEVRSFLFVVKINTSHDVVYILWAVNKISVPVLCMIRVVQSVD